MSATDGPLFPATTVNVSVLPAATLVGAELVDRLRSLDRVTSADRVTVSLVALPSIEPELTILTVDDCAPVATASVDEVVKMTVNVLLAPLATDAVEHWILLVRSEHPASEPVALKTAPLGFVMSMTTLLASAVPLFLTMALSVRLAPASTDAVVKADKVTERSL